MKATIYFTVYCLMAVFMAHVANAQIITQFEKAYGGAGFDFARSVEQTSDGGYIITGGTNSFGAGGVDVFLVKTDMNGDTVFTRTYGGPNNDGGGQVKQTPDGGYVIAGDTRSFGFGGRDVWLIKTDANGDTIFTKTFGSPSSDAGTSIGLTSDGGYIIAGATTGFGVGWNDVYLIKTDSNGNLIFQKTYAFGTYEGANYVEQTSDGGYIIGGVTYPGTKFLMFKTDALGNIVWTNVSVTGTVLEIHQTFDGGYIAAGTTPWLDFILVKTDASGNIIFTKTYGGLSAEWGLSMIQTTDGGYALAGETISFGAGQSDVWLVRTDANGDTIYTKTFGAAGVEYAHSIRQTSDGGFILAGQTTSFGAGNVDFYLIKVLEVPELATIKGSVFLDVDSNCAQNLLEEVGIPNRTVKATDGTGRAFFVFTDEDGDYKFSVPPDTYTISIVHTGLTKETCNSGAGITYNVTVAAGQIIPAGDFFLLSHICGADVFIIPSYPDCSPLFACPAGQIRIDPCPGCITEYCVTFENTGTEIIRAGADLILTLDPDVTFLAPDPIGTTCNLVDINPTINGNELSWVTSTELGIGESCAVCILSIANGGCGSLATNANIGGACGDEGGPPIEIVNQDAPQVDETCACSCDPNDKLIAPKGCGPFGNIAQGEELTYKIRFQNIGGTPALDVVIRDTLDTNLDITTLNVLASSHTVTGFQIEPGNVLVIRFDGINLPDSASDPVGSNGFVQFRIKPKDNLPEGTAITNQAAIIFDQNVPVITNSVLNTVRTVPSPIADFDFERRCETVASVFDFTYTGGTADSAEFFWDFGPNATPSTSTDENPAGIEFSSTGGEEVTLTVTRFGCTASATKSVEVENIVCGNNNNKIIICHVPPGNPQNSQTICVSQNSLAGHLQHGDCIGSCFSSGLAKMGGPIDEGKEDSEDGVKPLFIENEYSGSLEAYPNPFSHVTTVTFSLSETGHADLGIYNYMGQEVTVLYNDMARAGQLNSVEFNTEGLPSGLYYCIMHSGSEQRVIKLSALR